MANQTFEARAEALVPAPRTKVWQALVSSEGFAKIYEGITVESSWRVGDPIVWSGTWEGKAFRDEGSIVALEEPRRFEYTYWTSFWGPAPTPETVQHITNTFEEEAGGTRVTIVQTNISSVESRDHSQANWKDILDKLTARLSG